ncbi:hypothetical protein AAC387_Pa10g1159 [Persea americana]
MKRRKQTGLTLHGSGDVISNLPMDVMNLILMRLPIREAVRTSILSKNWRYRWVCIPDVVFNKASLMKGASEMEHAHVVDQVLLQHVGPILKFSCRCFVPSCSHINRWIAHLSRNGIEKLILMIAGEGDSYDVPSSIFYCQNLHHLELFNCNLKVPPTFKGFHNLKVLNLAVDISEAATECLVSKCPLLEWLKLKAYRYIWCVKIHAPNLRYLAVDGIFRDLSLGSSPLLTDLSISKYYRPSYLPRGCGGDLEPVNTNSFIQFIEYSHGIERLALKGHFLQFLCLGDVPEKLMAPYEHLKYLEIDINMDPKELLVTLCILRSSPNLKELKFMYWSHGREHEIDEDGLPGTEAEFWGAETRFDFSLSHLQKVEINGLTTSFNLEFIRYILSNAPVLETMKIYTDKYVGVEVSEILAKLFRFRRASARAECIYLGDEELEYGYFYEEIDE